MGRIIQVPFRAIVAAATGVRVQDDRQIKGTITMVKIHWPPGCNSLVLVALGKGRTQFCPDGSGTFLALDAVTETIEFNEPITPSEQLWFEVRNTDAINPHTISALVKVVEEE